MDAVHSLEKTLSEWYGKLPHLPLGARKWLGENIWWIVIIGIVLSVIGIFGLIVTLFTAFGISAYVSTLPYAAYSATSFGSIWITALIGLASLVLTTVLLAMAISPLKAKVKKGWTILFVIALIEFVLSVVGEVVTLDISGTVLSVIWLAIWGYFLFEIRDEFGRQPKVTEKKTKATAK